MTTNHNNTTPVSLDAFAVGRSSSTAFITVFQTRNPTASDINFQIQQRWYNTVLESEWILTGFSIVANVKSAVWQPISQSAIAVTETLTGNSGGAVGVDASNNINVVGDGTTINIVGSPSTHTLTASVSGTVITTVNGTTGSATGSGGAITINGGTTGLTTTGSGSTISLDGTLDVANGGTGDTSFIAYAPICGGTTTTGPLQSANTGISNSGYVLTSNGASALPTWQASGAGITTIDGDSGSITGSTVTIYANNAANKCGGSVLFSNSGTTSTLQLSDARSNTFLGIVSGNTTLTGFDNTGVGEGSLAALTTGQVNAGLGAGSFTNLTTGQQNVGIGASALGNIVTGSYNTTLGYEAGGNYTTSDSSNICVGNNVSGTAGESNVIRIGQQGSGSGQQNKCFIAGITGVTVSSSATVLLNTSTGQLGTISSSRRYKNNIIAIDAEFISILDLNPVTFTYKSEKDLETHYGLIAEEVENVIPELVLYDQEGRPDSVKYHELPALLLAEIQRLNKRIEALEQKSA